MNKKLRNWIEGAAMIGWLWLLWVMVRAALPARRKPKVHQGDKPLLPDAPALVVQPQLAKVLGGSDEALIVQKVHEWILYNERHDKRTHYRDGLWWTYNSYDEWHQDHFVHIPVSSLKRLFQKLAKLGVLIVVQHRQQKGDRRNWYTIDYAALMTMAKESHGVINLHPPSAQKSPMGKQIDPVGEQNAPLTTSESSTKKQQFPNHKSKPQPTKPPTPAPRPQPLPPAATIDDVVDGVPVDDLDSGVFSPFAESHDRTAQRESFGATTHAPSSPGSGRPPAPALTESALRLVDEMCVMFRDLTPVFATLLVQQHGEGRVRAVYGYVVNNQKLRSPVGFMRTELERDTLGLGEAGEIVQQKQTDAYGICNVCSSSRCQCEGSTPAPVEVSVTKPTNELWKMAHHQLELQLDTAAFRTFLYRAEFVAQDGENFTIGVHSTYAQTMLQGRLYRNVQRVLSDVCNHPVEIKFVVAGVADGAAA